MIFDGEGLDGVGVVIISDKDVVVSFGGLAGKTAGEVGVEFACCVIRVDDSVVHFVSSLVVD